MAEAFLEPKAQRVGITQKIVCHIQGVDHIHRCCMAHYHSYIELINCLRGVFRVVLNNQKYEFLTGDLLVINSNEVHSIDCISEGGGRYIVLRFEPELLYDSSLDIFEVKYVLPFTMNDMTPQKIFPHSEICATDIPRLMYDALKEFDDRKSGFELALRSDIYRIFVWILRYWNNNGIHLPRTSSMTSEHIQNMQVVLEYISNHYSEEISAESMARLANMSYSYFSRIFKQIMNKSFNDYLNFVRITEAEKLLTSTDRNITEIAYATGFSSSSYFIKIFDKYKGMSPSRFRKKFCAEPSGEPLPENE